MMFRALLLAWILTVGGGVPPPAPEPPPSVALPNPFVPEPIYSLFLQPQFARCRCPIYGFEDVHTWEDPDDRRIVFYEMTVVLSVKRTWGWEALGVQYVFRVAGGIATIETMSDPEPWPPIAPRGD